MTDTVILTIKDNVAELRVNRPYARNALNWVAQEQFAKTVTAVARNSQIQALIITGTGDKAFVSGGDLKELSHHPEKEAGARLNQIMSDALLQLTGLPIPVIAAVNGDAFGGGCEILTACDLRIATQQARFSFAQVRNGLTTGWGGTTRLVHLIGQSRAMELLLTARLFDAPEAQRIGLVHRLCLNGEDVRAIAHQWATELLQLPRRALAANKALVRAASHYSIAQTNRYETIFFTDLWSKPDHLEALTAFVEKRQPVFNREDHNQQTEE